MVNQQESILVNTPPISSLDGAYTVAVGMGRNAAKVYTRLAEEMAAVQNTETEKVFQDLAERETKQCSQVRDQANRVHANADIELDEAWFAHGLRDGVAREIAGNAYLLTPYRAFQLAVINKTRVFEVLSVVATAQDDQVIRQHTEVLANGLLSEISALRLLRRRAYRSETKTAIEQADLHTPPVDLENFNKAVLAVHTIIRTMTLAVRDIWLSDMTDETGKVLQALAEDFNDFPDAIASNGDRTALETSVRQDHDNLFSALRALLRELESAVDLFLEYAENSQSEAIVNAAQIKVERYVHRTARVRDELDATLSDDGSL